MPDGYGEFRPKFGFRTMAPHACAPALGPYATRKETPMSQIVYIVGAIVIVIAVLSFIGLA
jgi:hypothetical protein